MPPVADRPLAGRARALWSGLAGVAFPAIGTDVVVAPASALAPPGWVGVVGLAGATLVTVPDPATAAVVRRRPPAPIDDPGAWRARFAVAEHLGPAALAYLEPGAFRPYGGAVVERGDPGPLLAAADPDEVAESGLADLASPVHVLREAGRIVAAAGYERWPGGVAHLCLLTAAGHRGRGRGRTVATAAVRDALDAGLLPQWRARPAPSRRVAVALGFRELGVQLSLRVGQLASAATDAGIAVASSASGMSGSASR